MLHMNWSLIVDYYYYWKRYIWYIGWKIKKLLTGEKEKEAVLYIGGSEVLPPPLSPEEEQECLLALNTEDSEDARKKLQETLQRIINEGSTGLICIIL